MKFRVVCFVILLIIFFAPTAHAFTITSDPQYIVMNFSEINELNWAAPESQWQSTIKPKILDQLQQLKNKLPLGTSQRKLAWSTLQEYMNTPADTPNKQSYYAIKVRRIAEITEHINLPVFLPLNGFQWWDEQPELYNWWDPDGSKTPAKFFERQRTPDFKQRFVRGYNPQNIHNVEWQNFTTPMNLNWRNWGGGGFRLAPPPNLLSAQYQKTLEGRLFTILNELLPIINRWQAQGKSELFAGITIGTEISLNASVTSKDEFMPYGYRGIQDANCPTTNKNCGPSQQWTRQQLLTMRAEVVRTHLDNLARKITRLGIPKQRIYTHVWGETEPADPKYTNYAEAAFTPYARPGMSFYGFAEDPFALSTWSNAMRKNGNPSWGAVEYSADKTEEVWSGGLANTLDSASPAKVVTIYNWTEHKDTPAMRSIELALTKDPVKQSCEIPEILPLTADASASTQLNWQYLPSNPPIKFSPSLTLSMYKGLRINSATHVLEQSLEVDQTTTPTPQLKPGVYTWQLTFTGCSGKKMQTSEPRVLIVPVQLPKDTTPAWVKFVLKYQDK